MEYECSPLGDRGLLIQLGDAVDLELNAQVHRALLLLSQPKLPGVRAIVPSYAALYLELDLLALRCSGGEAALIQRIRTRLHEDRAVPTTILSRVIEIPTCYGGKDGPDLGEIAQRIGRSVEDVVALHTAPIYRVAQIGFQPGFPYLLGLSPQLTLPRLEQPRARVAAGSVAIAGAQTGIYPRASPGGWHLLGRTHVALFDPTSASPALLQAGDRVRFVAVKS